MRCRWQAAKWRPAQAGKTGTCSPPASISCSEACSTMKLSTLLIYLTVAAIAPAAAEEVAVIVNKANTQAVDKALVAKVYLGEIKSWPGGGPVVAYDLPEESAVRASF